MQLNATMLESQHEFVTSNAKKALFLGGVGCVHPDTKLDVHYKCTNELSTIDISCIENDISDIFDFSQKDISYKSFNGIGFDYRQGSKPFRKGVGPMFRVVSEEGEIIVYEKHEFLCSDLIYRYPSAFDPYNDLIGLLSTNPENVPYFIMEDIYLVFDRIFKYIKWFALRSKPFRSVAYLFTGKFFDPTIEQIIEYLQKLVIAIQENVEIFSVRITQYHSVSHPLPAPNLVHFYNEFAYELSRLCYDQLPRYIKGEKCKKEILKTLKHLTKIWESHDFRYHPSDKSRNKVLAIEPMGEGEYWDLQIPDTHNYVAHGMVHHNSGKTYTDGDLILRMAQEFPYTKGLLTAPTHQQLINSTVAAVTERWDELGLQRGLDYSLVTSGANKRIEILGQKVLLYSLSNDVPAKGVTAGYWIGDESAYIKKKPSIPVVQD